MQCSTLHAVLSNSFEYFLNTVPYLIHYVQVMAKVLSVPTLTAVSFGAGREAARPSQPLGSIPVGEGGRAMKVMRARPC